MRSRMAQTIDVHREDGCALSLHVFGREQAQAAKPFAHTPSFTLGDDGIRHGSAKKVADILDEMYEEPFYLMYHLRLPRE